VDPRTGRRAFSTSTQLNSLLRRARVLSLSWREAEDTLTEKRARLLATPTIYPTTGYVSSVFTSSRWHPSLDRPRPHTGIDIVAPRGTPVVASAHGRVSSVGHQGEYGLLVEIDHGYGVVTRYAHLSRPGVRSARRWSAATDRQCRPERARDGSAPALRGAGQRPAANPRRYILDTNVVPD
jgi:murein DD-endopeptidase MepM/ murein hydrolase activator NlpD